MSNSLDNTAPQSPNTIATAAEGDIVTAPCAEGESRFHSWAILLAAAGLSGVLSLGGCKRSGSVEAMPANAVAVVEGQVISRESFAGELARRAQLMLRNDSEAGQKAALLEEMIRFEALYQSALRAGCDKDPEIAANLKRMIVGKYQEGLLAKTTKLPVSEAEISEFYRNHQDQFGTPERVRVALIEFRVPRTATAEKRAEAARKAAAVLAEAKGAPAADGTFGSLAQTYSEDQASRYRGGDVGWLTTGVTNSAWPVSLSEAVFKLLNPGDFGPVVSTPSAFYLVRLTERQPADVRPLEMVKDGVIYLAAREKERKQQEEIYRELMRGLRIQTNQAVLESIRMPAITPPPAGPGTVSAEKRTL